MGQLIIENAHSRARIPPRETLATARNVLREEEIEFEWINIVFISDFYSRKLNRRYLSHDYTTDVLAFRLDEGSALQGEVYVNLDRARIQAGEHGVSFKNEVTRLVIHGLLHLVGYRDTTDSSGVKMKQKEEKYLQDYTKKNGHARKSH